MFDFGFWEVILILLIALIVVGPERLPVLARTTGLWLGKAKRIISDVKTEIDRELAAEELKKVMDEQNAMDDVYEVIEETRKVTSDIQQEIHKPVEEPAAPANPQIDSSQPDKATSS